jgi:hypothetical protein
MGGLQLIAKDKKGNVKQDFELSRDNNSGRKLEVNKLKEKDERRRIEGDSERSEKTA